MNIFIIMNNLVTFLFYRVAFETSNVQVSVLSKNLTLSVGAGSSELVFTLFETTSQQKKEELQWLLFSLAGSVNDLRAKLNGNPICLNITLLCRYLKIYVNKSKTSHFS